MDAALWALGVMLLLFVAVTLACTLVRKHGSTEDIDFPKIVAKNDFDKILRELCNIHLFSTRVLMRKSEMRRDDPHCEMNLLIC